VIHRAFIALLLGSALVRAEDAAVPTQRVGQPLEIRDLSGEWTDEYLQIRERMGTRIDRARVKGGR
jgi:hypothetical protein